MILEYQSLFPKLSIPKLDIDQLTAIETIANHKIPDYTIEAIKLRIYKWMCI